MGGFGGRLRLAGGDGGTLRCRLSLAEVLPAALCAASTGALPPHPHKLFEKSLTKNF